MSDESVQTFEDLINELKYGNPIASWKASLTIINYGKIAVAPLINVFKDVQIESNSFRNAANALRNLGQDALDAVITALDNQDEKVRFGAAYALGNCYEWKLNEPERRCDRAESESEFLARISYCQLYKEPLGMVDSLKTITALVRKLEDKVPQIRSEVIKALGKIEDSYRVVFDISQILLKDLDSQVRADAADALHNIGNAKAVRPLIKALTDRDKWVRYSVIRALGHIGDESAFESIANLYMNETDEDVCEIATSSLVSLNQKLAMLVLNEAVNSSKVVVRDTAILALREMEEAN